MEWMSYVVCICFFKQKTAYEMRISDWSSDVCSSDLQGRCTCSKDSHAAAGRTAGGRRSQVAASLCRGELLMDLTERLFSRGEPLRVQRGYRLISIIYLVVASAVVWASLAPLDEQVRAPGTVIVSSTSQVIQADRQSDAEGKSVYVRVEHGGPR